MRIYFPCLFLLVGTYLKLSGGAFMKGVLNVKINNYINRGGSNPSSTTLLKLLERSNQPLLNRKSHTKNYLNLYAI